MEVRRIPQYHNSVELCGGPLEFGASARCSPLSNPLLVVVCTACLVPKCVADDGSSFKDGIELLMGHDHSSIERLRCGWLAIVAQAALECWFVVAAGCDVAASCSLCMLPITTCCAVGVVATLFENAFDTLPMHSPGEESLRHSTGLAQA